MFLKPSRASTDPRLRSLVQKAVRRGYSETVERVSWRLIEMDDKTWLRSRAVVITFEECWPLASELFLERESGSKVNALHRAAISVKQKDAAGLGALAYAFHEGDTSTLENLQEIKPVRLVSEALSRPDAFFLWAMAQCSSEPQRNVVRAAKAYIAAATWGWDKTCILAGAYLASRGPIPALEVAPASDQKFPYWIALDKHTPQGKAALRNASIKLGIPYRQITWASFYFESAVTNTLSRSSWWEAEKTWRLSKVGLSLEDAAEVWERTRPVFRQFIRNEEAGLREAVEGGV